MKFALAAALATSLLLAGAVQAAPATPPSTTPIVLTDSITLDIAVPPAFLWDELKRMYIDGDKFRHLGFKLTRVEADPHAYLGGTIAEKTEAGVIDRREAHFTVIDDKQRFLALTAKYSNGPTAYVSYEVRRAADGRSTFQLIVHADTVVPRDPGVAPTQASVRKKVQADAAFHHQQLIDIWTAEATRIEAMAKAANAR
jgi:hypothetical protein